MRPWFNAAFCLLLLGLGWAIQLTVGYPFGRLEPLGPWAIVPAVVGTVGIAGCVALCFVAARTGRVFGALPLLPALVCVGIASVGWATRVTDVVEVFRSGEVSFTWQQERTRWLVSQLAPVQFAYALGLLWSALTCAGAATAAGCVRVETGGTGPDTLRWTWPLAGVLGLVVHVAITVISHSGLLYHLHGVLPRYGLYDIYRSVHQLVGWQGLPLEIPQMAGALWVVMLTVVLLGLRPRRHEFATDVPAGRQSARALASVGAVSGAVLLGLGAWAMISGTNLYWMFAMRDFTAEDKQYMLAHWFSSAASPGNIYGSSMPASLSLATLSVVLAGPILVTAIWKPSRWLLPASVGLLCLLAFAIPRWLVVPAVARDFDARCDMGCTEINRTGATLLLLPRPINTQMSKDRCHTDVGHPPVSEVALPIADVDTPHSHSHCPVFVTAIQVGPQVVRVDGDRMLPRPGRLERYPSCDHDWVEPLAENLQSRAQDAEAIARRRPNQPFRGSVNLFLDSSLPMSTVDCVRAIAAEAGFFRQHLMVQLPGRAAPLAPVHSVPLWIGADGHPGSPEYREPLDDDRPWSADVGPGEIVVSSPTGERFEGPDAYSIAAQLEAFLRSIHRPDVCIEFHPDLTLQQVAEAIAALIASGMFEEITCPPPLNAPRQGEPLESE